MPALRKKFLKKFGDFWEKVNERQWKQLFLKKIQILDLGGCSFKTFDFLYFPSPLSEIVQNQDLTLYLFITSSKHQQKISSSKLNFEIFWIAHPSLAISNLTISHP